MPQHITICKGRTVPTSSPADSVEEDVRTVLTSTPINSVTQLDELGRNVFFSFDIGLAANTEITLSQIEDDVFSLERFIMDFQLAGPSCQQVEELCGPPRQDLYGSGNMSSQLIDDFGQPICRMMTRSMSRS